MHSKMEQVNVRRICTSRIEVLKQTQSNDECCRTGIVVKESVMIFAMFMSVRESVDNV